MHADGERNTGLEAATKAALAVGGLLAIPEMDGAKCDFNDLHRERGAEAVKAAIANAKQPRAEEQNARTNAKAPSAGGDVDAKYEWPEPLDDAAFYGLLGKLLVTIEPHSEADPAALLLQTVAGFGVLVGRGPHARVEGDEHHGNLDVLLVGETSKGRKGTSWGRVRRVFQRVPGWPREVKGLTSGEGLKWAVRDPIENAKGEIVDEGESDKRLLVVEAEFAQALRVAQRPGNTLSVVMRECWDSGRLGTLTRHDTVVATGAHISIIGHITADELRAELTRTDTANGFANRFLFTCVRRSKALPFGGEELTKECADLARRLTTAAEQARSLSVKQRIARIRS